MDTKRLGSSICGALVGGAFGMAASIIFSWVMMWGAALPISLHEPFISAIPGFFAGALAGCLLGLVVKGVSPRMARTLQVVAGVSALGIILLAGYYVAPGSRMLPQPDVRRARTGSTPTVVQAAARTGAEASSQPVVPAPPSATDREFLDSVNKQFVPSEGSFGSNRNQQIALDGDKLVYQEDVRNPGFGQDYHVVYTANLTDLNASRLNDPKKYSLTAMAGYPEGGTEADIMLICKNDRKCVTSESVGHTGAYIAPASDPLRMQWTFISLYGIPYAHLEETGSGIRDMILRHSPLGSTASSQPLPVQPPPASALPQPEVLDAVSKVIMKVWNERPSRDEAEKMLTGLGFAPFKCSPPKDDTLAYVELNCASGASPRFEFVYYRGLLEYVHIFFHIADRTSYNYVFDELKKPTNLGDIHDENEDSPDVMDTWQQGETTCVTGRTCPQSVVIFSYRPEDTDHNILILYMHNSTVQRHVAEEAAEMLRRSQRDQR